MGGVAWTEEEDRLLRKCVEQYGEGTWHRVPLLAGLNRCRKSCRLRWLNYLRPNIKRGRFNGEEVELIIKLHRLLGNRWSLIASRLPGRTANDVKNYWNCHLSKKLSTTNDIAEATEQAMTNTSAEVIKPWAHNLVASSTQVADTEAAASGCEPPPEDVASASKGLPYGLCKTDQFDQTAVQKEEEDKFSGIRGMPENKDELGVDFEFDEIRMMGMEHCKSKWDLDNLMMDIELWSE